MAKLLTANEIIEKGNELNAIYADYKQEEKPRLKKIKWRIFYDAAENYRSTFGEYLRSNPADITKTL